MQSKNHSRNSHRFKKQRTNNNTTTNTNPFKSFKPNTSGFIPQDLADDDDINPSNEPSDFSHFLSPNSSPQRTKPTNQPIHINTSNSNTTPPNFQSSQSSHIPLNDNTNYHKNNKSNEKSNDDFIFEHLQRCNSMTVPFNNNNNNKKHQKIRPKDTYILDYIPFDWCIKKSLSFISNQSLEWCAKIPLKIKNAAMHKIPLQSLQIDNDLQKIQYEFYKHLIYYKYPNNKWNDTQLLIVKQFHNKHQNELQPLQLYKNKKENGQFVGNNNEIYRQNNDEIMYNLFVTRMNEWMYSYNSLYGLFRQRFCEYFYICYNNFFNIIFFYNKNENNEYIPQIIISNTHQTFRNKLKKQNIEFSTPLIDYEKNKNKNNNKENDIFDDMNIEELERNGIYIKKNKKRKMNGYSYKYSVEKTVMFIKGQKNVHNFYDFWMNEVYNYCFGVQKFHDLPVILCDKTFLNSQLCKIEMTKNICGFTENKKKMYSMKLNGYILPNIYNKMINLLYMSNQNVSIVSQLYDKISVGINYAAKNKLFKKIKEEKNLDFVSVNKIEINASDKKFMVHLQ